MGQLKVFSNFMLKVKTNIKWIGFFFILVFTAYPIITIVIDNKGIVRYLLAIFYLFGVIYGFLFVKREKMTSFKFIDLNIVFIILGTVIAYELSNIFSLSIVVSSSIVGLAGYLISRKHSFAIYT
ncbi:MAG: hypothetical protein CVV62_01295, partial [Tenericutes bacterium HGW-Tenericutes-7]